MRTVLAGAHLIGVELQACEVTGALFDARTQFPVGFNPRVSGMVDMDSMHPDVADDDGRG